MLKYNGNRREQPPPLGPEEQELMEAGRRALVGWKRWGGCPAGAHTPKLVKQVDYGSVGRKLETGNNCPVGGGGGGVSSVAIAKHHKLDGLKQQECILSQLWRPQSEIKTWAGLCSSEEYGGGSVLGLPAHTCSVGGPRFVDGVLTIFTAYSLCAGLSLCLYFLL